MSISVALISQIEYDSLDSTLVMAILSDYHPETVSSHVDEIRDQLGILQASAVPDETADVLSSALEPSDPDLEEAHDYQLDEAIYNAWEDDPTPMPGQVERNEWLSPPPEVGSSSSRPSMSSRTLSSRSEGTSHSAKSTSPTSIQEDEEWPEVDWQDEVDVLQSLFPNQWVKVSRLNYEEVELMDRPAEDLRAVYDEASSLQAAIDQLLSIELIKEAENTGIWADEEPTSGYPSEPEEDWRDASAAPRLLCHVSVIVVNVRSVISRICIGRLVEIVAIGWKWQDKEEGWISSRQEEDDHCASSGYASASSYTGRQLDICCTGLERMGDHLVPRSAPG